MMKPLKKTIGLLGVATLISCGTTPTPTILTGSVPEYKGEGYLLLSKMTHDLKFDTISVQADGTFTHEMKGITENGSYLLFLEYLGKNKGSLLCYLIPGTSLDVQVSGGPALDIFMGDTTTHYKLTPQFTGKAAKECDYLNLPLFGNYVYRNEDGTPVTFKNYQGQIAEHQAFMRKALEGTCEEFVQEKTGEIEALARGTEFRYYNFLRDDAIQDADFMTFVNSIDLNDENQLHYAMDYIALKLKMNKELYKDVPRMSRYFHYIKDHVSNKKTAEQIADGLMGSMINGMDPNDLKPAFEIYKQLSGKSEAFQRNEKVYQNLIKLLPGTKATDFDIQDTEGNALRFSDVIGKGKIAYIDFWATWCGPCCAEIPYMEKLAAHYKGNEKIVLISISLDDNRNKWLKKLEEDNPTWAQYLIPKAFESTFSKEYCVQGIPRFMLFDAEGRIIDLNAPRPSHKGIKEYLEKHMK